MEDTVDPDKVILCPACDLLLEKVSAAPDQSVICPRCATKLYAPRNNSLNRTLALTITGLILFAPANLLPLLTMEAIGIEDSGSIVESFLGLYEKGYYFVAVMVMLTSLVIPLIKLGLLLNVTLCLRLRRYPEWLPWAFRTYLNLDEWGMLEVYMIGILVTIIKMYHMAHIHYDLGFYCFIGLLISTLGSSAAMDEHHFWEMMETRPLPENDPGAELKRAGMHG
ncbi:MAG TPA: paraquat-inducible protein A [Thermodesulfobacteriaceae bacterium]|nr:paraquat-inducible protein A [Thermodesulfobacteriaceae bacterium]